jgi:heme-degrading monooxygenase HmoA
MIIWNELTMQRGQPMLAVIFEVQPKKAQFDRYLEIAGSLRPALEKIDGFVEIERFASKRTEGRLLSLSIWHDERALIEWRTLGVHRAAQRQGRSEIFADYRLRVGEIAAGAPRAPDLEASTAAAAQIVTISEFSPADRRFAADLGPLAAGAQPIIDSEAFESIYDPGKFLLLVSWRDFAAADRWRPGSVAGGEWRHRQVRIIRDYGMFERAQAPQYYPPATGTA